jgi:PAS/PAC sensor hybrid histidine kinase (EC 2.7.13.3)
MSDDPDRIHVLHVDDDPDFATLTARVLESECERLEVLTASSADEGLSRLETAAVDCVVSDYDMPGRNGVEFLEAVRERHQDLPFILFTGKGSEEIAAEAVRAGATDYLQKGAGTDQYALLANRVTNAAERYATERELRETHRRFRKLLERSADYAHVVDPDGTVKYVSPAIERVLGTSLRRSSASVRSSIFTPTTGRPSRPRWGRSSTSPEGRRLSRPASDTPTGLAVGGGARPEPARGADSRGGCRQRQRHHRPPGERSDG